ncbi:MAG TPA: TIGR00730 family Rossman fold protein [Cyclobacteriaceae bacterium]|nr:TIGR00730 family Rossman fold protein [Cyclobacteriaceae bacterium]
MIIIVEFKTIRLSFNLEKRCVDLEISSLAKNIEYIMKRVTVFCGSSSGSDKIFEEQAYLLGKTLAENKIDLVYGGAKVGLMGAVANGVLQNGGKVIGVLPNFLSVKEIAHEELTELILVETMHERKTKMNELSDGVIALPGGFGTLEELFEMVTWAQLGLHKKPVAILNTNGFYNSLIEMIQKMVDAGFLKQINQQMLLTSDNISGVLEKMKNYQAPVVAKWITKETT